MEHQENRKALDRYLSPVDVWAMAFGTMVGWGVFAMPGNTFLPVAGPAGTLIALTVGMCIMLVIGGNFSYLMGRSSITGGIYSYTKEAFGRDHAFLCAWFLCLSYLTIVFLNGTALFYIIRLLMGDAMQMGFHYTIAGNVIYLGETLASALVLGGVGVLFGWQSPCCSGDSRPGTGEIVQPGGALSKSPAAEEATGEPQKADFNGKRLLLAEDNEMNQMIAVAILEGAGFAIEIANDGLQAVQMVSSAPAGTYDVVLMDIQMPTMDGYTAAKRIRSLPEREKAEIPIVAVTANAFEEDRKVALEAGMNGHLAKPYDVEQMMTTLADILHLSCG